MTNHFKSLYIMAPKYAIFISKWNEEDVKYFDNLDEAKAEWNKILADRNALETDGGKNVVVSDPRLPWLSNF